MRTLFAVVACLLLSACNVVTVRVSALNDGRPRDERTYTIRPFSEDVGETDLRYQEFARVVQVVLDDAGLERVESDDDADLIVLLAYGVTGERDEIESYTTAHTVGTGGRYGYHSDGGFHGAVVVYNTDYFTRTLYRIELRLDALDADSVRGEGEVRPAWQLFAWAETTSDDLRTIVPYLAAASAPHVGGQTPNAVRVKIAPDDEALLRIIERSR